MAALLAEQKFLATREFLTAKDGGLYNVYANGGRPEAVTADLGKRWEFEQIALRLWPSASSIQGMNTAMFDLIEQHKIDPARVKKVRVALSQPVFDLHGKLAQLQGEVRRADFRPLHRGGDPARSGADARPVRARPLRRSEDAARRGRAGRAASGPVADRRAGRGRHRDRRHDAHGALRPSARFGRKPAVARADREQIPHLCRRRAAPVRHRGRRSMPSAIWKTWARSENSWTCSGRRRDAVKPNAQRWPPPAADDVDRQPTRLQSSALIRLAHPIPSASAAAGQERQYLGGAQ